MNETEQPNCPALATAKIVVNRCYGGFGLSHAAYEKLIEWGVPVRKYKNQERDPETNLYKNEPANEGEVIFDRELTPEGECSMNDLYWKYRESSVTGRYWDTWTRDSRTHPLIIRLVEEMGDDASGKYADLKIVEIPAGIQWHLEEYDGIEHVAEDHRTWA